MKIGEAARRAGVGVQTLRYYERRALIAAPARSASGYRDYPSSVVERVRFIKQAQAIGFSLEETRQLLDLRPGGTCGAVGALVAEKLADIDARIAALQAMRAHLVALGNGCVAGPRGVCGVLAGDREGAQSGR